MSELYSPSSIACKLGKDGRDLMPGRVAERLRGIDGTLPKVSIIAMKGPPITRKTEFANLIADSLGCPILSLEHFLDELQPPPEREEEAFRIICRMAHHHLSRGLFKNVVIDSPVSSAWHLTQLTTVASSLSPMPARVLIIECKPVNVYLWKMKLERHLARCPPLPCEWYNPRNWEDVEKAIKVNGDYDDERSVPGHELVSKLVLDPLLDHPVDDRRFIAEGSHLRIRPPPTPRFVEAVKYMIARDEGDGPPDVVVYHQWQQQQQQPEKGLLYCSSHGHDIVVSQPNENRDCMACQNQVTTSDDQVSYSCKDCTLSLHKKCAESGFNSSFRFFLRRPTRLSRSDPYNFHKKIACNPCRGRGKGFSDECASCLFETNLKCRKMPPVIKHFDTEEHLLTIVLLPAAAATEVYLCVACGNSDRFKMYLCKICRAAYHYKCVKLARRVEHVHGGHHHHLALKFSSEEAEDYICNECHELRDPMLWFYSCEDCPYELHPYCVHTKS